MSSTHEEDISIINLILDKLLSELHDLSKFSSSFSEEYEDAYEVDFDDEEEKTRKNIKSRVRTYSFDFMTDNSGIISLSFIPVFGIISVSLPEEGLFNEIEVAWGPDNKDIKIKFMRIWRTINNWEKIEIPRQNRERFINGVMECFPDIMDNIILRGEDDKNKKS